MYIYGPHIKGQYRLGAAMVHVPTSTIIFIDAGGTGETRTIMRVELVAIYTALDNFATQEWVGIFTDSVSSLLVICHRCTNSGTRGPQHYHHHMLLLSRITDLLEDL